jgi:hypothetical protein
MLHDAEVGLSRGRTMDGQIKSQAEADEDILAFDVPDAALERAASAERQAFTWMYCTKRLLLNCHWPE